MKLRYVYLHGLEAYNPTRLTVAMMELRLDEHRGVHLFDEQDLTAYTPGNIICETRSGRDSARAWFQANLAAEILASKEQNNKLESLIKLRNLAIEQRVICIDDLVNNKQVSHAKIYLKGLSNSRLKHLQITKVQIRQGYFNANRPNSNGRTAMPLRIRQFISTVFSVDELTEKLGLIYNRINPLMALVVVLTGAGEGQNVAEESLAKKVAKGLRELYVRGAVKSDGGIANTHFRTNILPFSTTLVSTHSVNHILYSAEIEWLNSIASSYVQADPANTANLKQMILSHYTKEDVMGSNINALITELDRLRKSALPRHEASIISDYPTAELTWQVSGRTEPQNTPARHSNTQQSIEYI